MKKTVGLDDTIAAISTPIGQGGIGIVRLSGIGAIETADRIFRSRTKLCKKESHTISYGVLINPETGEKIDEVLVSLMRAPKSYTKEDVVEINCHGGLVVTQKTLELCLQYGARLAEAGEFTKRAFLNGRIDLSQAEAVIDLIQAKTDLSCQAAANQLGGNLKQKVADLRQEILDMVASIEAAIDYPEHDIEEETYSSIFIGCKKVLDEIKTLLSSAQKGKILREGIEVVILGRPNVGKSSLLNKLLDEERAIVTSVAGTTRDTVEEYINIGGVPVKIVDTAGIRDTEDMVERIGVEKSKKYALEADLILLMLDASQPLEAEDKEILEFIQKKKALILLNKTDLKQKITEKELEPYLNKEMILPLSVLENRGLQALTEKLKELFFEGELEISDQILIGNVRHKNALLNAENSLKQALTTIETRMPEDFISMDLQETMRFLGEISGDTVDEEIIDRIFTKFCLGK